VKKFLKVIGIVFVVLLIIHFAAQFAGYGYLLKGLRASYLHGSTTASIDDEQFFKTHVIRASQNSNDWPVSAAYNKAALSDSLKNILAETKAIAFLIVKNDSLLSEHYWDHYTDSSRFNSFSMAKSITTMLAQVAIQKGIFTGWNQQVKTILPFLKGEYSDELELWHLSTMSSGLDWDEKYKDPFCVTARAYYGDDVKELMTKLPIVNEPGKEYNYQSGSTQLLGLCLIEKTRKSLAELTGEWLWQPLQAEYDATWHTDEVGTELAYCCFNSNARDFARFGNMMLHHGNWNGTQILDSAFVDMATKGALASHYGYSFWLYNYEGIPVYYQRGLLGQYIIVIPQYNTVVVRLGHHDIEVSTSPHSADFMVIVKEVMKMLKESSAEI